MKSNLNKVKLKEKKTSGREAQCIPSMLYVVFWHCGISSVALSHLITLLRGTKCATTIFIKHYFNSNILGKCVSVVQYFTLYALTK